MPSSSKILFFKKVAILLSIVWSVIVFIFFIYQLHSEQNHIVTQTITNAKDMAKQSEYLINWAFEERIKQGNQKAKSDLKTDFSLRDLIYKMNEERGARSVVEGNYLEDDFANTDENIKNAILEMQTTLKDSFAFYTNKNETYLFYIKPLLDDGTCSRCHIHDDKKPGDLLGNVNLKLKIPTFREYNPQSFNFILFTYLFTWLIGLAIIWWIRYKNKLFYDHSVRSYEESIYALVDMMERRDSYTAGHSIRVAYYASLIADYYGCSDNDIDKIYQAGMLHDIGKIEIPDALLLKPDKLNALEYELIKTHAKFGYELLCKEPFSELSTIVLHHHERYDGNGYPYGLSGEQIPLLSQIIAVADAFDAMTTNRAYRQSYSLQEALVVIQAESGKQFSPKIVSVALEVLKDISLPQNTTQMPKNALEEMRFSYYFKDQLTDSYNSSYLRFLFAHQKDYEKLCLNHIRCKNFTSYNRRYGWSSGNILLRTIVDTLKASYPNAIIVRVFGDNFLVIHLSEHVVINTANLELLLHDKGIALEHKHLDILAENIKDFDDLEEKILKR